jgi:multiple sugar transport system permease protein
LNVKFRSYSQKSALTAREDLIRKAMLMPAVLLLTGIMVPFLIGVFTSMTNKKLYSAKFSFVFLSNYLNNFSDPVFRESLTNTLLYVFLVILFQIPLGILAALLLDIPSRSKALMRTLLVFPLLIPPIVSSLMWKTMMQPTSGVLNYLLSLIGASPFSWLTSTRTSLLSLTIIDTWVYLPFTTIILLAGLQSLPQDILEASQVDGAGALRIFFEIKMPWMYPSVLLVLLFRVCDSLKAFELIYSTTRGGPMNSSRTLNIMAYEEAFRWSSSGKAMSVVFTLWILAFIASTFLMRKWNESGIE